MISSSFLIIMTSIFSIAGVGILLLLVVKNHSSISWKGRIIDPSTLEQTLAKVTKQNKQPAMGFALVNQNGILAKAVTGTAVAGQYLPVTIDSRFHIGSVAKSFTALLVQMMVEEETLCYDMTLEDALPDIAMRKEYRNMTLKDLLLSKAGIIPFQNPSFEDPHVVERLWNEIPANNTEPQDQRKEVAALVLNLPPAYDPSSKAVYSNVGWSIIGVILEKATQKSYETLLKERIFNPLDMTQSDVGGWPASLDRPDQPRGHYATAKNPTPQELSDPYTFPDWMNPAGGISCSITDLSLYVSEITAGLRGKGELLSAQGYKIIHTVHIEPLAKDFYIGNKQNLRSPMGYGWAVLKIHGTPASVAEGSGGTFYAVIGILPDLDMGFAAVTNCGNGRIAIVKMIKAATRLIL